MIRLKFTKVFLTLCGLFLLHPESGEIDKVESCEVVGEIIKVNFGYDWNVEFPSSEYRCLDEKND